MGFRSPEDYFSGGHHVPAIIPYGLRMIALCTFRLPPHAANECIRRRQGDKKAMRPIAKLL